MDDIRINKKTIRTSIINLSLLKFNFSFCSKILVKYNKQVELSSSLVNQASLVFLLNSENDNSDIVDSIHKILNVLKKKDEINDKNSEEPSYLTTNEQDFSSNKFVSVNKLSEYKTTDKNLLFYNNFRKNNFNKIIKSLILNINSFLKSEKQEPPNLVEKNILQETVRKENKIQKVTHKKFVDKSSSKKEHSKVSSNNKIDETSNYEKEELDSSEPETKKNNIESIIKDLNKTQRIKNFTSELKKINKKIIESQIQKIKFDKIGFDIVNKSTKFNKNIYNKVNKTIFSVINSDKRIQCFSKASKNIVLFNKKFKYQDTIKDLQNIISDYKENKNIIVHSKKKKIKTIFDTIYDNKLFQQKINKFNDITKYSTTNKINKLKYVSSNKTNIEKNIVLFNKKFKHQDTIKDLQNIISDYKENKSTIVQSKKKKIKTIFDTIYDNKLFQQKINKFNDITRYSTTNKINKLKYVSSSKTNVENITHNKKEFLQKNNKKVFKINKVKEIISKKDIVKSINFLNEIYNKRITKNKNNEKIIHDDYFSSYDNSYFSDIYNHFFKNIKNKDIIKNYGTTTLQYVKSILTTNKNKLFESINDINKFNYVEQTDLKRTNLNFHNLVHNKKLIKENQNIKDLNVESINNVKEQNYFRNIIHKNEVDIKKLVDECVTEKITKTQEEKSKNIHTHYNERVLRMIENNERRLNSSERTISKKEIQRMIDDSIPSINIKYIAKLVSERLEHKSNVNDYKSTF